MKTFPSCVLLFTLCVASVAHPEIQTFHSITSQTPGLPLATTASDKTAAQQHYDPLAGRQHLRSGIWDHALNGINPNDKNLGECVDEWRRTMVAGTIGNFVFWTAIAMTLALLLSLLFVYWLLRDRARRLDISVNILTQISNAYLDACGHALDAIEKHNLLADDYNVMAEKMTALERQKSENQRRIRSEAQRMSPEDSSRGDATTPDLPNTSQQNSNVEQIRQPDDMQARQRFANQINALQERNKTLRNSLNEALAQIDQLKRQPGAITGA